MDDHDDDVKQAPSSAKNEEDKVESQTEEKVHHPEEEISKDDTDVDNPMVQPKSESEVLEDEISEDALDDENLQVNYIDMEDDEDDEDLGLEKVATIYKTKTIEPAPSYDVSYVSNVQPANSCEEVIEGTVEVNESSELEQDMYEEEYESNRNEHDSEIIFFPIINEDSCESNENLEEDSCEESNENIEEGVSEDKDIIALNANDAVDIIPMRRVSLSFSEDNRLQDDASVEVELLPVAMKSVASSPIKPSVRRTVGLKKTRSAHPKVPKAPVQTSTSSLKNPATMNRVASHSVRFSSMRPTSSGQSIRSRSTPNRVVVDESNSFPKKTVSASVKRPPTPARERKIHSPSNPSLPRGISSEKKTTSFKRAPTPGRGVGRKPSFVNSSIDFLMGRNGSTNNNVVLRSKRPSSAPIKRNRSVKSSRPCTVPIDRDDSFGDSVPLKSSRTGTSIVWEFPVHSNIEDKGKKPSIVEEPALEKKQTQSQDSENATKSTNKSSEDVSTGKTQKVRSNNTSKTTEAMEGDKKKPRKSGRIASSTTNKTEKVRSINTSNTTEAIEGDIEKPRKASSRVGSSTRNKTEKVRSINASNTTEAMEGDIKKPRKARNIASSTRRKLETKTEFEEIDLDTHIGSERSDRRMRQNTQMANVEDSRDDECTTAGSIYTNVTAQSGATDTTKKAGNRSVKRLGTFGSPVDLEPEQEKSLLKPPRKIQKAKSKKVLKMTKGLGKGMENVKTTDLREKAGRRAYNSTKITQIETSKQKQRKQRFSLKMW